MNKCLLGDVAKSQTGPFGSQLHEADYVEKGTPIVTVEHLGEIGFTTQNLPFVSQKDTERLSKFLLEEGDIVFSRVGSIDRSVYVKKEQEGWMFSGRCLRVRCDKSKINPRYLSFYFKLADFKKMMLNISVGATMPSLNTKLMDSIPLNLPSREIQDKIASLLDSIDSKIENNNKVNQELESMAKTIYDYWFLQFEFPNEDGKPYKSSGGKMVWNEELKREIPEGWKVDFLGRLFTSKRGISYNSKSIEGSGVPMINLASFNVDGSYKEEGIKVYSGEYSEEKVVRPFDLLMCNTQQTAIDYKKDIVGKAFLVPDIFEGDIVTSHHVTTIQVKKDNIKYFLHRLFNTDYFHKYAAGFTNGTNILGLIFSGIEKYRLEIPDDAVLEKFADLILDIEMKKSKIIKENQELISLRDFLLPLLMNGQVGFKA